MTCDACLQQQRVTCDPYLQRVCEDHVGQWRELVQLGKISDEFCKFFRDSKDPEWSLVLQGSEAASPLGKTSANAAGGAAPAFKADTDAPAATRVRRHADVEEVSRMLNTKLNIDPALGQRHLSQSLNAFHYFCGLNNANGYIPYLMEMLPRMREVTLPLLSKIPIPHKMVIVSPYLLTGLARTLELEIAAFDEEKKDQVQQRVHAADGCACCRCAC